MAIQEVDGYWIFPKPVGFSYKFDILRPVLISKSQVATVRHWLKLIIMIGTEKIRAYNPTNQVGC